MSPWRTDDEVPSRHRRERDGGDRVPDPGQAVDCAQAEALLAGFGHDKTVIGDRAHDTDAVLRLIETAVATAVIPSRSSRKFPRPLHLETCRTRKLAERFFGKNKELRRVTTRYDKAASNFLSAVHLAASGFLLRRVANQLFESVPQDTLRYGAADGA